MKRVLITGGAGYVGAVLVPHLLNNGYSVVVYDLFIYGKEVLPAHPNLTCIQADIRDAQSFTQAVQGCDAVIHLACISNDPSFELDAGLGKSINFDCFPHLVKASKKAGVGRFIYASSSSVYGVKPGQNVTEELELEPLTDYSKFKAQCEPILLNEANDSFQVVVIRPATVCGYSPRLRLDLTVNILSNHAFNNRKIRVFGGAQMRPNIHIEDMADAYLLLLNADSAKVNQAIFNAGYENHTVSEIASMVKKIVGPDVQIVTEPTDDNRSYHISSEKIKKILGFQSSRTIEDAVKGLLNAFEAGKVPNSFQDSRYYNIKRMQEISLS